MVSLPHVPCRDTVVGLKRPVTRTVLRARTRVTQSSSLFSQPPPAPVPRPPNGNGQPTLQNFIKHVLASSDDIVTIGLDKHIHSNAPSGGSATPNHSRASDEAYAAELRRMLHITEREKSFLQQELDNLTRMFVSLVQSLARATSSNCSSTDTSSDDDATNGANTIMNDNDNVDLIALLQGNTALRAVHEDPAISSCVVQHPGALCCTSTSISKDAFNGVAVVNMRTVARLADDPQMKQSLTIDDLAGLATQAMCNSASDVCREHARSLNRAVLGTERLKMHKELCHTLQCGKIVQVLNHSVSEFGHENFKLLLKDPVTGRSIHALFKPCVDGDSGGWHRVPIEWVAYQLNLMMGMDYVPPVAFLHNIHIPGHGHFESGAMLYWSENARQLKNYPPEQWGVPKEALLSDTRILDVLLHNSDRHHGNLLMGEHWVEGRAGEDGGWKGALRPVLIDHAAGFRADAHVCMSHENAFQTGAVHRVSASTYLRLRFLDASAITARFSDFLSEREMRDLLHRRNNVLVYLDRLVENQGYSETVIECSSLEPAAMYTSA